MPGQGRSTFISDLVRREVKYLEFFLFAEISVADADFRVTHRDTFIVRS